MIQGCHSNFTSATENLILSILQATLVSKAAFQTLLKKSFTIKQVPFWIRKSYYTLTNLVSGLKYSTYFFLSYSNDKILKGFDKGLMAGWF